MTYNFPYYQRLIEGEGFEKAKDLYSYLYSYTGTTPSFITKLCVRAKKSNRISVRHLNMKDFTGELQLVKKIYNDAWQDNWGFVPMTDAQIDFLAADLKPLVNPALVYFAFVDDKPAGFFMAMPDYNEIFIKMKGRLFPFGIFRLLTGRRGIKRIRVLTLGVSDPFRHLGIELLFFDELFRVGPSFGYLGGEISWVLEDNYKMNRIAERFCGPPYRTHRMYTKDI